MRNKKPIIFVHIPKAGGTTIGGIMHRQYGRHHCLNIKKADIPQLKTLPEHEKDKIKAIQGHRAFGLHKYFNKEIIYITMLREPVDRVISYYHFYLSGTARDHEKQKKIISNNYSLKDYVQKGVFPNEENRQVKVLSGNLDIPHGVCSREMLDTAIRNIDEQFDMVGIMEYFDEFLIMLMLELGWRYPFYWKRNVTHNRPRKEDIDKETLRIIEKYNQLDIELYQYAKTKFENRLKQMDDTFFKKLETFRKANPYFKIPGEIKNYMASIYRKFYRR